jgi:CheY-like chemotaxis protein
MTIAHLPKLPKKVPYMKNILIVDDEPTFLQLLVTSLQTSLPDLNVLSADNGRTAVKILKSARVELVVTDLKMPDMDGFDLLAYLNSRLPPIPAIAMSAFGTPEVKEKVQGLGALRFLSKPLDFSIAAEAISDGLKGNSSGGFVKGISISSFLQLIEMEQKSCLVEIQEEHKKQRGFFCFDKGDLIDATCGELTGKAAALELIALDKADISFHDLPKGKVTRRMDEGLMGLIMEAMRLKDEAMEEEEADLLEPDQEQGLAAEEKQVSISQAQSEENELLAQAVRLAEGHHFQQAQNVLGKILKNSPRNVKAWLWYSRVSDDIIMIGRCLKNARKIAPNDEEVIREITRFKLIYGMEIGEDNLPCCPFCSFVLEDGSSHCPSCNAFLRIDGMFLPAPRHADREVLEKAIIRYKSILDHEKEDFNAHYCLGLTHLNLKRWAEGMHHLSKAADLSLKNPPLVKKLDRVLKFLTIRDDF